MEIGNRIKSARKEKRLTQKALAEKLNISTITIQNYENNRRKPSLEMINKIAESLEISITELINWDSLTDYETHYTISKVLSLSSTESEESLQLQSKISYSLHEIIAFAEKIYGPDIFTDKNGINFIHTDDYAELYDNVTSLIENKIIKLMNSNKNNQ